jgi:hypothetical protein
MWQDEAAVLWKGRRMGDTGPECGLEMSEQDARKLYQTALSKAATIAAGSVSQGFDDSRRKSWSEFKCFLGKVGQCLNVENATNLDVIAFIPGWWIPAAKPDEVQRRRESDVCFCGERSYPAIGEEYSMMGRRDDDNPAKQKSVRSYCEGYRNHLHARGVREKRAKVFKEQKVYDLVTYLEQQIEGSAGIHRCVLLMDLCAIRYMWESWCWGKVREELERRQVDFESWEPLPGWSSTSKQEPSAHINLSSGNRGGFTKSAARMIKEMERQGQGSARGFLFWPLTRQRDGFEDVPLSSAALRKRVQIHLKDAGLFEGETLHSFRRSAVQNAAKMEGYDVARLMELGR